MSHALRQLIALRDAGSRRGIASYCTANPLVIETCLEQALELGDDVLLEATANQVNQSGGYTGMDPAEFRAFALGLADELGFPQDRLILGGDHLGPLVWQGEPEAIAMGRAVELVRAYVLAGFTKIHLDTSMSLGDDPQGRPLPVEVAARRGAALCQACEEAYRTLHARDAAAEPPVYVIGSEVPIPGGGQRGGGGPAVTRPEAFESTLSAYHAAFSRAGLVDAFHRVVAVVVQPGVEFSDTELYPYDRGRAASLTAAARAIPGIVLEGHSTDYQSAAALREMVEDGIAILKVGPALTFALREGLFALSMMERELVPAGEQSGFIERLDRAMIQRPQDWNRHYAGSPGQLALKRKYSFSDRCRYYLSDAALTEAAERLFRNLDGITIPLGMLHQFLPRQYYRVRSGSLPLRARALAKDCVAALIEDYNYSTHRHYMAASLFYD